MSLNIVKIFGFTHLSISKAQITYFFRIQNKKRPQLHFKLDNDIISNFLLYRKLQKNKNTKKIIQKIKISSTIVF